MNLKQSFIQGNYILLLLLFIGSLLRLYNFWDWSLTNDELSALSRLKFESITELLQKGVKPDGHPAFVQVFLYYWTSTFGNSPFIVRLPFVISGILTLIYFYKVANYLLGKHRALIGLSILVVSQLFIQYAQIARPYSIGLLFVLIFYYGWVKFIRQEASKTDYLLFILFGVLSFLTHYFSGLIVAIVLISGLFKLTKKNWVQYIILAGAIVILFLPHLSITLHQLSIGGVSWLSKPDADFIILFIEFLFNDSALFLFSTTMLLVVGFYIKKFTLFSKKTLGFFLLFLIPYLIAYLYSIYISPLLQFSVLIFFAPFIILFIVSTLPEIFPKKLLYSILTVVIISGIFSLIAERDFYTKRAFANYQQVAELSIEYEKESGDSELLSISNFNSKNHIQYYINQTDSTYKFDIIDADLPEKLIEIKQQLLKPEVKLVMISFANTLVPFEVHELVRSYFPKIHKRHKFFNSEVIIYEKGTNDREVFFESNFDEKENTNWSIKQDNFQDSIYFTEPTSYLIKPNEEYSLTFRSTINHVFTEEDNYLYISALVKSNKPSDLKLVVSVEREGGKAPLLWRGTDYLYNSFGNNWSTVHYVLERKDNFKETDKIAIYFWNRGNSSVYVDEFKIINFTDSDYNYYEF